MEKVDVKCKIGYFVLKFIHICLAVFGNLDFLDLHYGAFIFNVYKKKKPP